ncbi:MAG: tRNA nucleotidyltransferase, partial [Crocinitomicaceae bacterium]|nr:tRNA nucleotidyltransferase [Crocinitomicaceae bacterium]
MNLREHISSPLFETIGKSAALLGIEVFAIGGMVRDLLLKRPNKDYDFVTNGNGIALAEAVAKALGVRKVTVYKNFGTAHFRYEDLDIEFVGARKESYRSHSRKPEIEAGTLQEDQNRRDFTINALAISLQEESYGELIDPFNGLLDLKSKTIRTPLDPDITYSDDPLRMLRAIRFATQLGFSIEQHSFEAIRRNASRLQIISMERISSEVNKMVLSANPGTGFRMMFDTGLLHEFFPEMILLHGVERKKGISHKDNFFHTLQVLDNLAKTSDDLWLRWAAILHDIAKP